MKFSIILVVHNAEETLFRCIDAILKVDYPKEDYELILINNASTDRTFRIATSYDIRVIGTRKLLKNSQAMELGSKCAVFDNLLFIDQRTLVKKDILNCINKINYSPLIAGETNIDKYRSSHDTFLYLVHSKLYYPYFPQSKHAPELWIDKKKYKKVNKNKLILSIERDFFKWINEDGFDYNNGNEDLFKKIVFEHNVKILSHTTINIDYISKLNVKVKHDIVEQGFKWARKNLKSFNILSALYYLIHVMILVIVILYPNVALGVIAGLYILFLIYLAESKKDFWILFRVAPGEIIRFYSGTLKYLTSKK